jgi:antitoxin VapB
MRRSSSWPAFVLMSAWLAGKIKLFLPFRAVMLIHTYTFLLQSIKRRSWMRVTVHIPDDLGPKLKLAATKEGLSISALTAKALENYLAQRRKKAAGSKLLGLVRRDSVTTDAREELERGRMDDRT